jgi:hypothetical protein
MRATVAYSATKNIYDYYKMIEDNGGLKGLKTFFKKELKITDDDWEEMLYWEKDEIERNETEEEKELKLKKEQEKEQEKRLERNRKARERYAMKKKNIIENKDI